MSDDGKQDLDPDDLVSYARGIAEFAQKIVERAEASEGTDEDEYWNRELLSGLRNSLAHQDLTRDELTEILGTLYREMGRVLGDADYTLDRVRALQSIDDVAAAPADKTATAGPAVPTSEPGKVATPAPSWIESAAFFVPKSIREPWLGDLLEDRARWVDAGISERNVFWRTLSQVTIAILYGLKELVKDVLSMRSA